jgi:Protein of unknown function (DUF4013)
MSTPINPYEPPKPEPVQTEMPSLDAWYMDYMGGLNFVMSKANWFTNAFMCGLCILIPIVGPIVVWGYAYETVDLLHRTNQKRYLDFRWERFGDYLARGIGPFLVTLVFAIPQTIINFSIQFALGLNFGFMPQLPAPGQPANFQDDLLQNIAINTLFQWCVQFVFSYLAWPFQLRGGLSEQIGQSFNVSASLKFFQKTWFESFVCLIILVACWTVAVLLSIVTCCVGYIPALGYMTLFGSWLSFNLYRVYLSRGGEPIPLKPLSPAVEMMLAQESGQFKPPM